MKKAIEIDGKPLTRTSGLVRVCRLRDEYYQFVEEPESFRAQLSQRSRRYADVLTFLQEVPDRTPKYPFHMECDSAAVLQLDTFEHWWKRQINDKTRNMVRKAQKAGVEIRLTELNEELIRGIQVIYDESPIRQGRPFKHYRKPLDLLRREHETFLERSQFLGAYYQGQLIGFAKLVHGREVSNLMNIISMIAHRDKAPTNGLISKAVEISTSRGVRYLQYGTGNSRSIGDFKRHHGFEEFRVPRYYLPLNPWGTIALRLGLHRRLVDRLPERLRDRFLLLRSRWMARRLRGLSAR
jgi:hypothetical protein